MKFVPLDEVNQEVPQGLSFVPLEEASKPSLSFVPLAETAQTIEEPYFDPMTGAQITGIAPSTKLGPKDSVLTGTRLTPEQMAETPQIPGVKAEERKLYDIASPAEREALAKKDPTFATINDYYAKQDEVAQQKIADFQLAGVQPKVDPYAFDTRLEKRAESLRMQGLAADVADAEAARAIREGNVSKVSPFSEIRAAPKAYDIEQEYRLRPEMTGIEETGQVLKRAGAKGVAGLAQGAGGVNRFIGDMLGLDTSNTTTLLNDINDYTQAIGQPASKPVSIVEGAVSSITQQLPALIGGVATGSEPLVLGSMFYNAFGQNYDEGKRRGLDTTDSAMRSTANSLLEVIGEKLGLGNQLKGLKAAVNGLPISDVSTYLAKALAKEIPGEQLTYAGQFAVDKGYGMNPEAGIKEFFQGAMDTMATTVVQGGIMMGAGAGTAKLAQQVSRPTPPEEVSYKDAMSTILKDKGFTFESKAQEKKVVDQVLEDAATTATDQPSRLKAFAQRIADFSNAEEDKLTGFIDNLKDKFKALTAPKEATTEGDALDKQFADTVTKYQQQGFTAADAEKLANEDFKELGYGDQLIARAGKPGISVSGEPSGTIPGTTGTGRTDLAGTGTTTGVAGSGETTELNTLAAELKAKFNLTDEQALKAATESLRQKQMAAGMGAPTAVEPTAEEDLKTLNKLKRRLADADRAERRSEDTSPNSPTKLKVQKIRAEMDAFFEESEPRRAKRIAELTGQQTTPAEVTSTEITPAKPKGRPKAVKTAEEIAAAQETRKQQAAMGRDAINAINRANNVLSKPFNAEADFATEKEAQEALDEFNNKRRVVLEAVYAISVDPNQKNKTAGIRAKEMLSKVTPQEAENAKLRHETRQKTKATAAPTLSKEDIGSFGRVTNIEDVQPLIGESTNRNNNVKYDTFTNATQAINWVAKNGNVFEKFLAKRIAPFLQGVKLVIVDDISQVPKRFQADFEGAAGLYYESKSGRTIYLDRASGMNNTIFLHEALHGATMARINRFIKDFADNVAIPKHLEDAMLEMHRTMFAARDRLDALKELGIADDRVLALEKAGAFDDVKEFVAYGMSHPDMQEFLMQTKGVYAGEATESSLFNKFVQGIRKFFEMGAEHKSAMQDLIIVTNKLLNAPDEAITQEDTAAAKKTNKKAQAIDKNLEKLRLSNNANDAVEDIGKLIQEHGAEGYIDLLQARFDDMGSGFISKLLYAMQTIDIIRWVGDRIPALKKIDALQNEMASMRARLLASSAKKADKLAAFIRKNGSVVLSDTMHLARLERISPTQYADVTTALANDPVIKHYENLILDPNKTVEQKASYKGKITSRSKAITKMYAQWDKLGKQKGGHEMYIMVREFYKDNYTATRTLLDEQINAMNIDAEAKAKLLKSVRLMQEQTLSGEDKELDGMKQSAIPEDYFPLKRDGKYWLRVAKGPTGREFYLFPSGAARNLYLARRAKELGLNKNDGSVFSKGDDINSLRKDFQDSSLMLQEIFANIEKVTTNPKYDTSKYASAEEANAALKEELKDQIYQTYLMTMPERSFRKQFLHAEKITGFSADVLQNFKTSATSYANQLSKLKYGVQLSNELQNARDSLTPEYRVPEKPLPTDERAKLELFINEMAIRTNEEINPPEEGQVVTRINQFAFLMLLTSGASAATQMASVPIMVMPTLNAEYGYGASAKAFAKYSQLWKSMGVTKKEANGDLTFTAPSMGSSKMVRANPVLQRAFEAATEKYNLFQLTNTSVITNRARTPDSSYESKVGTGLRISFNAMTAMFSGSERMSREITYMMTFELEYAKTKDFDASVQKAIDTTHEVLGRYDNFTRPRILRNAFGRTVGQFKQYAVFMSSWFIRNGYTVFSEGLLEAEGRQAMHRLSGVLVMGGLFHGLVGMPLYSTICSTIDAVLDNLGDEEEKRKRRASNPLTADDSNLRFRYEFLPKYFGQIEIPGLDGRQHRLNELLEKGPISALTDMNIGSRTSFDGLWFREAKPGKNYLETVQNYILANMGPGVSTGINMVGGIDDMLAGHIDRGLEKMVPAFFKGSFVAERMRKEGAETKGGADILKKSEVNELNYIASVLGFTPTRLARLQEKNFQYQKQITEATNERTALLRRLDETIMDPENKQKSADIKDIFKKIDKFNKRYPAEAFVIEPDDIERSIEAYAKKRGLTIRGQYIDEKLAPYLMKPTKAVTPLQ
jgi:hypothetical protein